MKLDIILRTCQKSKLDENLSDWTRICGNKREDMLNRCLLSLINCINNCNFNIKLTVLDDNSENDFILKLKKFLKNCNKETSLINLEKVGYNNSAFEQFLMASECDDLVYVVEDDYLHEEDAISNLLNAYYYLSKRFDGPVILHPDDDGWNYAEGNEKKTLLLHDGLRYWRSISHTTHTIFTEAKNLKDNFESFSKLANEYPNLVEQNTIDLLYKNFETGNGHINVFSPIPSIAYHMSYIDHKIVSTTQSTWRQLWDTNRYLEMVDGWFNYADFYKNIVHSLPNEANIIEVGSWFGKSTIGMSNINKSIGKDCKIYAVDTWEGSNEEVEHREKIEYLKSINTTLYDEFLFNIDVYGVKENIIPIRKSSEQASRDFGNHFFDLIIIDASHDYDSVLNDIKFWISKVKKGGILAGDDYDEKFPNVKKAVNDYFGYGNINIIGNTWFKIV